GRGEEPQSGALFRVDDHARPDRALAERPGAAVRPARRLGAAETAARAGRAIPERPELPVVPDDQRREHRPEPAGGEYRHQRRSAVEPGGAGAADRPGAPHGPDAAGAGL